MVLWILHYGSLLTTFTYFDILPGSDQQPHTSVSQIKICIQSFLFLRLISKHAYGGVPVGIVREQVMK